jgi:hypothetical protein
MRTIHCTSNILLKIKNNVMNLRTPTKRRVCEDLWNDGQILICHIPRCLNKPNTGKNDDNHDGINDDDQEDKGEEEEKYEEAE